MNFLNSLLQNFSDTAPTPVERDRIISDLKGMAVQLNAQRSMHLVLRK